MHDPIETRCAAREWATHRGLKSFSENPPAAIGIDTAEPAGTDGQHDPPPPRRKIGQCSPIAAVDAGGHGVADWAGGGRASGSCTNSRCVGLGFDTLNGEPARSKRESTTQDGDPLPIRRLRSSQIASALNLRA